MYIKRNALAFSAVLSDGDSSLIHNTFFMRAGIVTQSCESTSFLSGDSKLGISCISIYYIVYLPK